MPVAIEPVAVTAINQERENFLELDPGDRPTHRTTATAEHYTALEGARSLAGYCRVPKFDR